LKIKNVLSLKKIKKMEFLEIENEFEWVIKVMESSTNLEHLKTSEKLFQNFLDKRRAFISDIIIIKLTNNFNINKNNILNKLI
jgi:hypothetical protein